MIDIKKVIREAAVKNKLVIKDDDPVMLFASTLNLMLNELDASLAAVLEKYRNDHNKIARSWRYDAEDSAARILNAALDAGREATAKTMNEGANKVTALIHEELSSAIRQQKTALDGAAAEIRRCSVLMLFASGAVVVSSILSLILPLVF